MADKRIVMFFTVAGMTLGGFIPVLFGDNNFLDGWSLLATTLGGVVGIYVGVKIAKRF